MDERRREQRGRTLRSGKIVFNNRQSVIDCIVRDLSDGGACLQVDAATTVPPSFELIVDGNEASRNSRVAWRSDTRIGVEFRDADRRASVDDGAAVRPEPPALAETPGGTELLRSELLTLRAALDEVPVGIVLLDSATRAQFINRAFRRMWRLPDGKADGKPPFVALMYHGRDTNAYAIPVEDLDDYVAERVALVTAGHPDPLDLRLTDGEVLRLNCTVLPSGGRMLCYTYVTDSVRRSDELATHDAVTGLWNRRQFDMLAAAEWSRFQRYHRPLSLVLLDIDGFKEVNDRLGHAGADAAIKQVAAICMDGKRTSDVVARIGNDEFAVLLPETDLKQAHVVAERLREQIGCQRNGVDGADAAITVSIGLASASLGMSGMGALTRLANEALTTAKLAGRNCVRGLTAVADGERLAAE
jgi:diguanylate cyclase (GGDEF)-like protein